MNNTSTEIAAGLRALADMIEANPEIAEYFAYTLTSFGINAHISHGDKAAVMGQLARIALRHKATVTKDINDTFHNLVIHLGVVKVDVIAYREEVCEWVSTGTEKVTETVPDPDALAAVPVVEVTTERETGTWVCRSLLNAQAGA